MNGWALAALTASLLIYSRQCMEAALQAASVFVTGVMPALFPMMVLCRLQSPGEKTEHSNAQLWAGTALFAFASGSPASAQRVRSLWEARRTREPLALSALTGVMSPLFFVGTLAAWTGEQTGAWIMLGCHWAGAALTALVFRGRAQSAASPHAPLPAQRPALARAVSEAAAALLAVLGAMMLFSIASALLEALLSSLAPGWAKKNARVLALAWAIMEIGGGASAVVRAWPAPPLALLCALCSFGGLSLWTQNLLYLSPCVRPARLLGVRAVHAALSGALCAAALSVYPQAQAAFAPAAAAACSPFGLWPLGLVMIAASFRRPS